MRDLAQQAVFGEDKESARREIRKAAKKAGIFLSSIQELYDRIAREECTGFTVPAFNIRTLTFDAASALFRAIKKQKAGAFILELAGSEKEYTDQSFEEYLMVCLSAGVKENFKGPLFFQGDHFKCKEGKGNHIKVTRDLIKEAIAAGFYSIDIDCSALPIEKNFTQAAELTAFIRELEPENLTISVGGEIGEIGGENTTLKDLQNFLQGYKKMLKQQGDFKGIIKVAVQTGTSHGGLMLASGKLKEIEADFKTLKELSDEARKYELAGAVQHGASTLPEKYFKRFPKTGACEIHLATVFQNIVYDSAYFPQDLKEKMYSWLENKFPEERKSTQTDVQFLYKFRKHALGPFKKEIWNIPQKNLKKICEELEAKYLFFLKSLNVSNTRDLIEETYKRQ